MSARFEIERAAFHKAICLDLLKTGPAGIPTNADSGNRISIEIAKGILRRISKKSREGARQPAQKAGVSFEEACSVFLEATFTPLSHLRPGKWRIERVTGRGRVELAKYEQYAHLAELQRLLEEQPQFRAVINADYMIAPDIVIFREPESDETINAPEEFVNESIAKLSSLRKRYNPNFLLHASISCKWTFRSDRAQNSRSEALTLIRNRKGRAPHIAVVTGEPLPGRLASLALGTGDLDCVYHFALYEMIESARESGSEDSMESLDTMVSGKRLKDISDLPLDLAI